LSDQVTSTGDNNSPQPYRKEFQNKVVLAALLVLDAVVVAVLLLSEGALHWLSTLSFMARITERLDPYLAIATFVQMAIIIAGFTAHLLLNIWRHLFDSYGGGPKPSLGIAVLASSTLCLGIVLYLPHESSVQEAGSNPGMTSSDSPLPMRLPALFRLQRPIRSSARPTQQFVVDHKVTEIELKTPVAYASFKTFILVLDDQELQGYQVRNGELSCTVDRQALSPGVHSLAVHEKQKGSARTDIQRFEFEIIDSMR